MKRDSRKGLKLDRKLIFFHSRVSKSERNIILLEPFPEKFFEFLLRCFAAFFNEIARGELMKAR